MMSDPTSLYRKRVRALRKELGRHDLSCGYRRRLQALLSYYRNLAKSEEGVTDRN